MSNLLQLPAVMNPDQFAGANNGPVLPNTAMPLPPNQPQSLAAAAPAPDAPDLQQPPVTGVDLLANSFLQHLLQRTPPPPQSAQQPAGSFASKLASAVGNVGAGLGDAAHAGDRPGGWLSGITNTLAARNQRVTEEGRAQEAAAERKKIDDVNIARAQTDTLIAQQTLRHADSAGKREAFQSDQAVASDLDSVNTPKSASGLDSDGLTQWYHDHPKEAPGATVVVSGLKPTVDAQGNEFLRPQYTVYGDIPPVKLSDDTAALLNKFGAKSDVPWQSGMEMPGSTYIRAVKNAKLAQAQDLQSQKLIAEINKDRGEGDKAEQSALDEKTRQQYGVDIAPEMQHVAGDPVRALDQLKNSKDPGAAEMARKVTAYYGPDVVARLTEAKIKEANENVRHAADMASRTSDARQTAGLNQILKDTEKVGDVFKQNDSAKRNIAAAKTGDELASQLTPLMSALGVSTFAGVHRINQTEIDNAGPEVGSYYRRLNNLLDKAGKGQLSPDSLKEANDLFDRLSSTAYDHYASQQIFTSAQRGLPDETLILAPNGIDTTSIGAVKKQRATAALPPAPQGQVSVQIPGQPSGFIPAANLQKFRQTHPDAIVGVQ